MNVLRLVEIRGDVHAGGDGADVADGDMGRLLHHVAEGAGKLDLTRALHDADLHLQQVAACLGVCQAVDHAHQVLAVCQFVEHLAAAKHFGDHLGGDLQALDLAKGNSLGGLSANGGDLSFQVADARFSGVEIDQLIQCLVRPLHHAAGEPVALDLLGEQMVLGDGFLFLAGVGVELHDLHAVKQGKGNSLHIIGGGDENAIGKIQGDLQEMVAEEFVLLGVKDLQ